MNCSDIILHVIPTHRNYGGHYFPETSFHLASKEHKLCSQYKKLTDRVNIRQVIRTVAQSGSLLSVWKMSYLFFFFSSMLQTPNILMNTFIIMFQEKRHFWRPCSRQLSDRKCIIHSDKLWGHMSHYWVSSYIEDWGLNPIYGLHLYHFYQGLG